MKRGDERKRGTNEALNHHDQEHGHAFGHGYATRRNWGTGNPVSVAMESQHTHARTSIWCISMAGCHAGISEEGDASTQDAEVFNTARRLEGQICLHRTFKAPADPRSPSTVGMPASYLKNRSQVGLEETQRSRAARAHHCITPCQSPWRKDSSATRSIPQTLRHNLRSSTKSGGNSHVLRHIGPRSRKPYIIPL